MKEIFGSYHKDMKVADLHFHTNVSEDVRRGAGMDPHEAVDLALDTGLHALAITDHHEVYGAFEARNYVERHNFPLEIIPGIEVDTPEGHVVGLYVANPIEKSQSIEETIRKIHRQGGLAIAPHPFLRSPLRKPPPIGILPATLERIIKDTDPEIYFDGYEVYSQGAADVVEARKGQAIDANPLSFDFYRENEETLGAALASSDGHGCTVGRARTGFSGELKDAIKNRQTVALVLEIPELHVIWEKAVRRFGQDRVQGRGGILRRRLEARYNSAKE